MNANSGYCTNEENLSDYIQLCRLVFNLPAAENPQRLIADIATNFAAINAKERDTQLALALPDLCQRLRLRPYEFFCVVLALACELDGKCRNAVQELSGAAVPTFDLSAGLYSSCNGGSLGLAESVRAAAPDSSLRFVLELEQSNPMQPLLFSPLVLRRNVLHFLTCGQIAGSCFYHVATAPASLLPLHQTVVQAVARGVRRMRQSEIQYLFLAGKEGSGKRTLVLRAAGPTAVCLNICCGELAHAQQGALTAWSYQLMMDAAFARGIVCVYGYVPEHRAAVDILLRPMLEYGLPLVLLSDTEDCAAPPLCGRTPLRLAAGALSPADYALAQEYFCAEYQVLPAERPDFYRLTIGRLKAAWLQAQELCGSEGENSPNKKQFAKAVSMLSGKVPKAQVVEAQVRLTDLIITHETAEKLKMVRGFIQHHRTAARAKRLAYGRGVTALFYGPSGTGKTMAAAALANEMGLELLKIDLSLIFDKYIGETEKHLAEVFAQARERSCMLFFDEADALFSKRTEISSSHDRYANVETSYLLQSIEQYDGVVLLATNLFGNFDEAFLRRINVLVRFCMPNGQQRLLLWQQALEGVSLSPDVDLPLLAGEVELSPAVIWAAASGAAVLAAQSGSAVSMPAISAALKNEMEKQGKTLMDILAI